MSEWFLWASAGAVCGWLAVGVAILFGRYLKNRKNTPRKKNGDCLLIGNPGSGAKKLYQSGLLKKRFENVCFYERIHAGLLDLFPDESVNWTCLNRFDSIIIYGWLSGSDIELIREFLLFNIIKSERRLSTYLPEVQEHDTQVAVLFERKENKSLECWRWNASTIDAAALREKGNIVYQEGKKNRPK